jgi:hypothetical protein
VLRLLVTANFVPSSVIVFTRMMVAIRSSETSALTRATKVVCPWHLTLSQGPTS